MSVHTRRLRTGTAIKAQGSKELHLQSSMQVSYVPMPKIQILIFIHSCWAAYAHKVGACSILKMPAFELGYFQQQQEKRFFDELLSIYAYFITCGRFIG